MSEVIVIQREYIVEYIQYILYMPFCFFLSFPLTSFNFLLSLLYLFSDAFCPLFLSSINLSCLLFIFSLSTPLLILSYIIYSSLNSSPIFPPASFHFPSSRHISHSSFLSFPLFDIFLQICCIWWTHLSGSEGTDYYDLLPPSCCAYNVIGSGCSSQRQSNSVKVEHASETSQVMASFLATLPLSRPHIGLYGLGQSILSLRSPSLHIKEQISCRGCEWAEEEGGTYAWCIAPPR